MFHTVKLLEKKTTTKSKIGWKLDLGLSNLTYCKNVVWVAYFIGFFVVSQHKNYSIAVNV